MRKPERGRAGTLRTRKEAPEARDEPGTSGPQDLILGWQSVAGNAAVARLLARQPAPPTKEGTTPVTDDEPPVTHTGAVGAQDWADRAWKYGQAKQWERCRHAWAEAYKLYPVATFLYNQATCLENLGRIPEAIAMYKAYLADNPAETDVEKTKEHVKRLEGGGGAPEKVDHPGGSQDSTKAPAGTPDADDGPVTHTGIEGAQDWADRAYRYQDKKEWEKARHAFEEAYKLYPVPTFLFNEGTCLEYLGRFPEAIAMYEAYLAANPAETDIDKTREHLRKLKEAHGGAPGTSGGGEQQKIGEAGGGTPAPAPAPAGKQGPPEEPITETGREGASKWFDRAQAAYVAKDFAKAYDGFMNAYKLFPQPQFLYNAAASKQLAGDLDAAIAMYDRYLAEAPDASDAEKVRKALEKLKQKPMPAGPAPDPAAADPPITETGADGASKWFERAQAAYLAKQYAKAYDGFMHAYHLLPRPEFLYNAAASLQLGGDLDAAIAMYDRYLAEAPGASDAEKVRKAIEKLRQKEIGGKVDDAGGGSPGRVDSDDGPITATGTDGSRQWFDRGERQFAAGKYEDAVQSFGKAFELDPKPDFVFNQGAALEKEGRSAAAAAAFEHYLAISPGAKDYSEVVARVKKLRAQAASDPIADPWADEAAGADPTATGVKGAQQWFDKGQAAYMVGDYPGAQAAFMHAYDALPRPDFIYNAAAALDMGGDAAGAVALYERYLAEKPGASDAAKVQKRIAKLKAKAGGAAEPGAESAEPPIEETGKDGAHKWYDRGEQQFRAGKFEEAVHSFGTAFELDPSTAYVYDQGLALEKQGRPAAAAAAYERYLALKPDAKNHDELIGRVKKLLGQAAADPIIDPWADEAAGPDPSAQGKEGAKQWYEKAAVSFQVGDFRAAHAGFMQAFGLWPRAEYLFDAARALDEAGDTAGAIALYERSLSEGGGMKDTAKVQRLIDGLKEKSGGSGGEPSPP